MTSIAQPLDNQPAGKARRARQGTRLPEDWRRTDADIAWQRGMGIPDEFARPHTANFKDHFLASTSPRAWKLDWSRAWKVWMRTEWMRQPLYKREHYRQAFEAEQARRAGQLPVRVPEALVR